MKRVIALTRQGFLLAVLLISGLLQPSIGQVNKPPILFLINDNTAFIDKRGQVVISANCNCRVV